MAFLTGLFLIDAPASALNNGRGGDTLAEVKKISTPAGVFPYVSAQSFRYWLRDSLAGHPDWAASPTTRSGAGAKQQAYSEGNPIKYWDDDLLGYMRAEKSGTLTRVSPLRTSTVVALTPSRPTEDFGVMSRGEGNPVLHGHEFYRTILKGSLALDFGASGTFTVNERTGYHNLNEALIAEAEQFGATKSGDKAWRLPDAQRLERIQALLWGLSRIAGGAKQTLHYTDVSFAFVLLAVTKGGNQPFSYAVRGNTRGEPEINPEALRQALDVFGDDLLSPLIVGRTAGFFDGADSAFEGARERGANVVLAGHSRQALEEISGLLAANPGWLS